MTTLEIDRNKQRYIMLCRQHIQREGLEKLLTYLDSTDFYIAPSSTRFHLNEDGGLCLHSINVFESLVTLYESYAKPIINGGEGPFKDEISMESLAIVGLFHDLCKVKIYHKVKKWKKDDNNKWLSYSSYEIKDEFPLGHGEKSCLILNWFIHLKSEELLAIRWHMGMFDLPPMGSSQYLSYSTATEKSPLVVLLHTADMLTSKFKENTTTF